MRLRTATMAVLLAAGCFGAAAGSAGHVAASRSFRAPRALPHTLYGVTADDVTAISRLVASSRHLAHAPVTRIYFDVRQGPRAYGGAIRALRPVSYLMGELLDSADETAISTAAYASRVKSYLAAFGSAVDIWEIGNEVNGNWTGPYRVVAAKIQAAYGQVQARHLRSALTLYYNHGCGDGPAELDPLAFSRRYVPASVRSGLSYVFLSYYPGQCGGLRPSVSTWTGYFEKLHALYPRARLGFGEIGLDAPATRATVQSARALIGRYYGLPIRLPYYAGGYFWWYYAEDCLPYQSKPLWRAINAGFKAEEAAIGSKK
jgi:hypothetical protein